MNFKSFQSFQDVVLSQLTSLRFQSEVMDLTPSCTPESASGREL
jgi:hypothetical protein